MTNRLTFGQWLREQRRAQRLTQETLGQAVGCAAETIRKIETGRAYVSAQLVELLTTYFGVPDVEQPAFIRWARGGLPGARPTVQPAKLAEPSLALPALPLTVTPLVGREAEIAAVSRLLDQPGVRLVSLTGPPGIGKTRLALAVAAAHTPAAVFVPLATVRDPARVGPTIAATLGLAEQPGQDSTAQLVANLSRQPLLLVLDNCEQVLEAAPWLAWLLGAAPPLQLLVTSREVLHLSAEYEYVVRPLAGPDPQQLPSLEEVGNYPAVALFVQRAQAVQPDFTLTEANVGAVAALCVQLDGIPLALELAAARSKLFPPEALVPQLEKRLQLLTWGAQDLPPRQQTLRQAIDWSYDLLDPPARQLFARLAVFVGGWPVESASVVCRTLTSEVSNPSMLDGLVALADKSLLVPGHGVGEDPRFHMLETIREYAWERLEAGDEAGMVRNQHAAYFRNLAETAELALTGAQQRHWLDRLAEEHDNVRAALAWTLAQGDAETALRLVGSYWRFWYTRGFWSEGRQWLEAALALEQGAPRWRAKALHGAGALARSQGDFGHATARLEQSLALWRNLGDKLRQAQVLTQLGNMALNRDEPVRGAAFYQESLELYQALSDQQGIANMFYGLGLVAVGQGDLLQAAPLYTRSLALYRALDNKQGIGLTLMSLGTIAFQQGDYPQARALYDESLTLNRALGSQGGIAAGLWHLGHVAAAQGEVGRAAALYGESLELHTELGDRATRAMVLHDLGQLFQAQGDPVRAAALFTESLQLYREQDNRASMAILIASLAGIVASRGDLGRAARLLGGAQELLATSEAQPTVLDRRTFERNLEMVRILCDPMRWAIATAQGQRLTLDQLVAEAAGDELVTGRPTG